MRAAVYARFSSDLQRETSIDDQVAVARRYAADQGWVIAESCVFTDSALSGASMDRPGLRALRAAAAQSPRTYDVLLVDDSSRVSRDLADAVRFLQELQFTGIRVIYISQHIDSANDQAETLIGVHGIVDSLYLREMAKKIKRGLAGQVSRGFATGGVTFGYRTVPVVDPSGRVDVNGYPVLEGKRVEIVPVEAAIVVRIFQQFVAGYGATRIVDELNRNNVPGPRGETWKRGAVQWILQNEKYTGRLIWGRRRFERRPGTRQKVVRAVPREQWHILERPELRIVAPELWEAAVARWRDVRAVLGRTMGPKGLMRGRNACMFSPHLFSGFMTCAVCGGSVTVVHHGHGSPRYGCTRNHRNGATACHNRVQVRAQVADARMLGRLRAELLDADVVAYITEQVSAAMNRELEQQPAHRRELEVQREAVRQQLDRLLTLAEQGQAVGPALASRLAQRERELADLDAALTASPAVLRDRLRVIPTWVRAQLGDLAALLSEAPERTKAEFQRMGVRVSMQPIYDEQPRPFYRATVNASLTCLAGTSDLGSPTTDGSLLQSNGSRTPLTFVVDLPAHSRPVDAQRKRQVG